MIKMLTYDGQADAGQIEVPTLLIWGGQDTATPLYMGEKLNQLIADSKLLMIDQATHGLPIQQPKVILREIYDWQTKRRKS